MIKITHEHIMSMTARYRFLDDFIEPR